MTETGSKASEAEELAEEPTIEPSGPLSTAAPGRSGAGDRRRASGLDRRRGARLRPQTLVVALGALAAVLLVLTVVFASLWDGARGERGDLDTIREVSGSFADRFLTLDSEDVEATKRAVLALSTGAFRRTYEEGLETGVLAAILELGHTRTESTVEEIYVGEVDSRSAHVIVQTETTSLTVDAEGVEQPPRVLTFWLELDLVRQDEGWLVDGVRNLNFGAGPSPAPVATSPTTAAPLPG